MRHLSSGLLVVLSAGGEVVGESNHISGEGLRPGVFGMGGGVRRLRDGCARQLVAVDVVILVRNKTSVGYCTGAQHEILFVILERSAILKTVSS